jgi:hypothetical protein
VPLPQLFLLVLSTDAAGGFAATLDGGLGVGDIVFQVMLQDPGATFGTGFSNALQVTFEP